MVTHEFNIIMGLSANVPAGSISTIKTMGEDHNVNVEDDQVVSINDNDGPGGYRGRHTKP